MLCIALSSPHWWSIPFTKNLLLIGLQSLHKQANWFRLVFFSNVCFIHCLLLWCTLWISHYLPVLLLTCSRGQRSGNEHKRWTLTRVQLTSEKELWSFNLFPHRPSFYKTPTDHITINTSSGLNQSIFASQPIRRTLLPPGALGALGAVFTTRLSQLPFF